MSHVINGRATATALRVGDMVRCPDGQLGVLTRHDVFSPCWVAVGGFNPLPFTWRDLKVATAEEIIAAKLMGVGCNQAPAVQQLIRKRRRYEGLLNVGNLT